jgi:hypothetical protein
MLSPLRSRLAPALAAVLLSLSPALALAADEKIDPKVIYNDARTAAAEGRHADAVKAFKRAYELEQNPQYQLEMAKSLAADRKLLEANKVLNEIINANPPVIWPVKNAAQKELESVEQRIPWIQIAVVGPAQNLTSTTIDGKEIDAENEIPYDPGLHVIAADADGYEPAETTITLEEGQHLTVDLKLKRIGGAKSPSGSDSGGTSTVVEGGDTTTKPSGGSRGGGGDLTSGPFFIPMVVGAGVGVVGIGVGTVFGIMALNKTAEAKADCDGNTCPDTARVRRARDAALVNGNVSTVAFIVGGVGLAAGATMLILQLTSSPPPKKVQTSAFIRPYIGAGEAGVFGAF